MLKSKWIASVLALALIVTPVQGVTAAEAGTGNATATAMEATVTSVTDGNAAVETLDVPQGLAWTAANGFLTAQWNAVSSKTGEQVVYDVEVYREGDSDPTYREYGVQGTTYLIPQEWLLGGNHQFRVKARYPKDNIGASDFSEFSPSYKVKKLPRPTGLVWEQYNTQLIAGWDAITDVSSVLYDFELYREGETDPCIVAPGIRDNHYYISTEGLTDGTYRFHVKAREFGGEGIAGYYSDYSAPFVLGGQNRLAAPTAKWGENWLPVLDDSLNPGQIRYMEAEIYKDGADTGYGAALGLGSDGIDYSQINRVLFYSYINASGAYQFTLRAYPTEEARDAGFMYSASSELSEVKNYVKPDESMEVPTVKPHATLPGVFEVSNLEGAIGCAMELYYDQGSNGTTWVKVGTSTHAWRDQAAADKTIYYDFRHFIEEGSSNYGLGQYRVQARAISGNIDEVANSDLSYLLEGDPSVISSLPLDMTPVYDNAGSSSSDTEIAPAPTVSDEKVAEIKNSLQEIMNANTNATDALADIKSSENKAELGAAMQQDSSVADLMSTLEKDYVKENNITVSKNIQSKVNTFMDPNAISVVGAGLNVTSGNVALDVSVPEEWVDFGNKFHNYNNLQFEIKLVGDGLAEHGKLDVPVLITMPIPKGLSARNLEIIHCKTDGSLERISLRNNGDGTISFAVTEFSTFAFISPIEEQTNDSSDSDDSSDSGSGSGSAEVVYTVDWNAVLATVTANQAGTTDITTGNHMEVSEQLLQSLKNTKGVLAMHNGKGITVTVSGRDLKKTNQKVEITLAEDPDIPASAKSAILANALYSRSFEMKEKVRYSVKMDIHFNVGKQFAGKYANLYHYDELTGTMKLEGSFRITDTGAAMFLLWHGDEYILTVTDQAPKGVTAGGVSNATYTVEAGDNLSTIAAKSGVALGRILAANPQIQNPDLIHVGQKIVIR